jgi:hypothetical protein
VCSRKTVDIEVENESTLREFIEKLKSTLRLLNPTLEASNNKILYAPKPASLEEKHRFKLDYTFR